MDMRSAKNYVFWLFCQFELITCSYLMEPWEKVLFYSFNTGMVGMLLYTTYTCVAAQVGTALRLLWHCLGNQPDSAASVVK